MNKRTEEIIAAYKGGLSLQEIGFAEGVTGERIRQILKAAGVTYKDSGNRQRVLSNCAAAEAKRILSRERRCQSGYGCDFSTYKTVTGSNKFGRIGPLAKAYWDHKNNAKRSRITWTITLPEYAGLVGPHLDQIGKGQMTLCRSDKSGPFSRENCSIVSQSENSRMTNGFMKGRDRQKERSQKRQAEAIRLEALGLCRREIAKRMGLSKTTVNSYFYRESHE